MTIFYQKFNAPITTLPTPLGPNSLVRFISTKVDKSVAPDIDNTYVNLTKDDRILITAAIRFGLRRFEFNTQTKANTWDANAESIPIAGLFNDLGATIGIRTNETSYTIFVDDKEVYTYKKRINEDATGVSYLANAGKASALSDPIAVDIARAY